MVTVTILHTLCVILWTAMFLVAYIKKMPFMEKLRTNKDRKWHWERNSSEWNKMLKDTVINLLFLHFVVFPFTLWLTNLSGLQFRTDLESFPTTKELAFQIFFCMICEDFAFYWTHWLLHTKYFYKLIHKQHHEYDTPFSSVAE